jgi:magnesium transporter
VLCCFQLEGGTLRKLAEPSSAGLPDGALWIDVNEPSDAEEAQLERLLGVNVPSREDVSEIQTSSRLIARDGALYMSAIVAYGQEMEPLQTLPVIFVRIGDRLITIRYGQPDAVGQFVERANRGEWRLYDADSILAALLEVIVDRIADRLEFIGADLKKIEHAIFRREIASPGRPHRPNITRRIRVLQEAIERIGIHHMTSFGLRDCLHSLERLLAFRRAHGHDHPATTQFHAIEGDLRAIADYDQDLNNSMDFMVNATVGLIDVQQNKVIYLLSILGMVITPPVVIASIYGMNFDDMPELHWRWGYAWALGLMVLSAWVPWLVFKLKRWL